MIEKHVKHDDQPTHTSIETSLDDDRPSGKLDDCGTPRVAREIANENYGSVIIMESKPQKCAMQLSNQTNSKRYPSTFIS